MKIVRFNYRGQPRYGLLRDDHIELIQGDPFDEITTSGISVSLTKAELIAPAAPSKVVAVGLNYLDHAAELDMELPKEPCIFMKPSTSIVGHNQSIIYPEMSSQVEFEAELAIIIKKEAKSVPIDDTGDYIFGFTCANDVTARDLQKSDCQWTRAKSFDTFCPLGPHIETELSAEDLYIRSRVNGEIRQDSRTSQMVFQFGYLISFISTVMTLMPGDVILTGTPVGVDYLYRGDEVEVEVEGIGVLTNTVL